MLNQSHQQAFSRVAPGGIGEFYCGQRAHGRPRHVAMDSLLDNKFDGISRRQCGMAKIMGGFYMQSPCAANSAFAAVLDNPDGIAILQSVIDGTVFFMFFWGR
ncbi:MAG: hypothetical protein HKL96_01875 [Phycisphaerales bacterium]|nr:hypothetical protein [Phycisphaerales bacterium]